MLTVDSARVFHHELRDSPVQPATADSDHTHNTENELNYQCIRIYLLFLEYRVSSYTVSFSTHFVEIILLRITFRFVLEWLPSFDCILGLSAPHGLLVFSI
jgi:hypothetical protein